MKIVKRIVSEKGTQFKACRCEFSNGESYYCYCAFPGNTSEMCDMFADSEFQTVKCNCRCHEMYARAVETYIQVGDTVKIVGESITGYRHRIGNLAIITNIDNFAGRRRYHIDEAKITTRSGTVYTATGSGVVYHLESLQLIIKATERAPAMEMEVVDATC